MGLLSRLGRAASSFGKHYTNTAGAGMGFGALAGGGLNAYGDLQATGQIDPGHVLDGMVGGGLIGVLPGAGLGAVRGAIGAGRAFGLSPEIVATAKNILRTRGMSPQRMKKLADDDLVRLAFDVSE